MLKTTEVSPQKFARNEEQPEAESKERVLKFWNLELNLLLYIHSDQYTFRWIQCASETFTREQICVEDSMQEGNQE